MTPSSKPSPLKPSFLAQAPSLVKIAFRAGTGLAMFALITLSSVAITRALTAERIATNQEASAYRIVAEVAPAGHDGHLLDHTITLPASPPLGQPKPFTAWQAVTDGNVIGLVVPVATTQGYSGRIEMLVGITAQGILSGVRISDHRETPGLGDAIEARKSDWIEQFSGLSSESVHLDDDGIDTLTGATITSRAVTEAVRNSLQWYRERDTSQPPPQERHHEPGH
ncbi:MAG: RnfABCDGE type electron transport complex subunit G [Halomonas sp.]|uniref:RnfABCDGE type electron transport complex subunit G n=1 Tax=Halomonas sp. TaxID=1486246 RepID=UPI003F933466